MKRISRRNFLKAAGVGAAALGLAACGGSSSSTASSTASSAVASSLLSLLLHWPPVCWQAAALPLPQAARLLPLLHLPLPLRT